MILTWLVVEEQRQRPQKGPLGKTLKSIRQIQCRENQLYFPLRKNSKFSRSQNFKFEKFKQDTRKRIPSSNRGYSYREIERRGNTEIRGAPKTHFTEKR